LFVKAEYKVDHEAVPIIEKFKPIFVNFIRNLDLSSLEEYRSFYIEHKDLLHAYGSDNTQFTTDLHQSPSLILSALGIAATEVRYDLV
jgi:hypothetical protein